MKSEVITDIGEDLLSELGDFGERSFAVAAPLAWNRLPEKIRHLQSLQLFKSTCNKVWTVLDERDGAVVEVAGIGNGSHLDHMQDSSFSRTA